MLKEVDIKNLVSQNNTLPIVDVRTPAEYEKGHIPGAINIPLFSNEERAVVGTLYKQVSKDKAYETGYKYVEPKLKSFLTRVQDIALDKELIVHCWRGGLRSRSFADYLNKNGFKASIIKGGYKSFRKIAIDDYPDNIQLNVLGGYTGSGKTKVLLKMQKLGYQVIDLEGIAKHKGSAFGAINNCKQPTPEQFENEIYCKFKKLDLSKPIWVEDESNSIGHVYITRKLFLKMREARLFFLDIPKDKRALELVNEYYLGNNDELEQNITKISKRLGGEKTNKAIEYLNKNDYYNVAMICLDYYDKYYLKGMQKRDANKTTIIKIEDINYNSIIEKLR